MSVYFDSFMIVTHSLAYLLPVRLPPFPSFFSRQSMTRTCWKWCGRKQRQQLQPSLRAAALLRSNNSSRCWLCSAIICGNYLCALPAHCASLFAVSLCTSTVLLDVLVALCSSDFCNEQIMIHNLQISKRHSFSSGCQGILREKKSRPRFSHHNRAPKLQHGRTSAGISAGARAGAGVRACF